MASTDKEDEELIKETLLSKGIDGVKGALMDKLNSWKRVELNIAVIGQSGVGKSSFINAMRNIEADDEGGAPVGAVETTSEIKTYHLPEAPNLTIWDLPGVGTMNFPQSTYLEKIKFETYDIFVIISATRFLELDYWLVKEVNKSGHHCLLVRTKIDSDLYNEQRAHRNSIDEAAIIERIRKAFANTAVELGHETIPTYLISNFDPDKFDFPILKETIINDFNGPKREAILLSLSGLSGQTKKLFEQKKEELAKRIPKIANVSAIGGLTPIPGLSLFVDITILVGEYNFYRRQFGLDEASVRSLSKTLNTPIEVLRKQLGLLVDVSSKLMGYLAAQSTSATAASLLSVGAPIIGSLVAAGIAYGTTFFALKKILDNTFEEGLQLLDRINENIREQSFRF